MFKILCIPESKYLQGFRKVLALRVGIDGEFYTPQEQIFHVTDTSRGRTGFLFRDSKQYLTVCNGFMVVNNLSEFDWAYERERTIFYEMPLAFDTYDEVKEFVNQWFIKGMFKGAYEHHPEWKWRDESDGGHLYANGSEMIMPQECFEVQEIRDGKLIGVAPICTFLPFRA